MSLTIQFYAANPEELVAHFASAESRSAAYQRLATYPIVDFSLHLSIPEDMDSLCRALNKQDPNVLVVFRNMLIEQLWHDGAIESLTLVTDPFVHALAQMNDNEIKQVGLEWASTFSYEQPLDQTPAFHAVQQLRQVAKEAFIQQKSLILRLFGSTKF
jgi:hypothetical protein